MIWESKGKLNPLELQEQMIPTWVVFMQVFNKFIMF